MRCGTNVEQMIMVNALFFRLMTKGKMHKVHNSFVNTSMYELHISLFFKQ